MLQSSQDRRAILLSGASTQRQRPFGSARMSHAKNREGLMKPTDFPELHELERIVSSASAHLTVQTVCEVTSDDQKLPVYSLCLGNTDASVPAVGFFAGIHGLERIGTQVLLTYLQSLLAQAGKTVGAASPVALAAEKSVDRHCARRFSHLCAAKRAGARV